MGKKLVKAVALALRHFRHLANVSQEELADSANLDRTYISGVERGVRNITLDSLEQIVDGLGVDLQTFLAEVSNQIDRL
jgi:transcriptional regulator with XRE-family HTH domain